MKVVIYSDGGCRPNPGPAAAAAVVLDESGKTLRYVAKHIGDATNNIAEWRGFQLGLEAARDLGATSVEAFTDSMLVVQQFNGEKSIHVEAMRYIAMDVSKLCRAAFHGHVTVAHVRRELNAAPDALCNAVLDGTYRDPDGADDAASARGPVIETGEPITVSFVVTYSIHESAASDRLCAGGTVGDRKALRKRVAADLERKLLLAGYVDGKYTVGRIS